ncbi:hypothetical protein N8Z24_00500 [bacterium]|nr:hypothetical protein [bacterium]
MAKTLKFSNGDIVREFSNVGYQVVSDNTKLKQDVANSLTTAVRSSTGLGCGLEELVADDMDNAVSAHSSFPIIFDFQTKVRIGLQRLKEAQRDYSFLQRSPKELIYDFSPATLWRTMEDPRSIQWRVDVLTEDGATSFSLNGLVRI